VQSGSIVSGQQNILLSPSSGYFIDPDDGASKCLWNISELLPNYTASYPWGQ